MGLGSGTIGVGHMWQGGKGWVVFVVYFCRMCETFVKIKGATERFLNNCRSIAHYLDRLKCETFVKTKALIDIVFMVVDRPLIASIGESVKHSSKSRVRPSDCGTMAKRHDR